MRHLAVHFLAGLAHRAHDEPLGQEAVGDFHALIEQAPGVVADIEDDALEAARLLGLLLEILKPLQNLGVRDGREHAQLDVAVPFSEQAPLDRLDLEFLALDVHGERVAAAKEGKHDLAAGWALDPRDGVVPVERRRLDPVDAFDEVAALDARAPGRRALDGGYHHEPALALFEVDADADDLGVAFGFLLELLVLVGVHEARMRVEHLGQAAGRAVHQLTLGDVLDVVVLDVREHLGEDGELVVGVEASGG